MPTPAAGDSGVATRAAAGARSARPTARDLRGRDLVSAIRAELAAVEPARACCRAAERAGLGRQASGRARSAAVARLAVRLESPTDRAAFDWPTAAEHCRWAYLRGRFLAQGSLSVTQGRTHLEFTVDPEEAARLAQQLADVGLPATVRVRRGRGVVTWKGTDRVLTFLRRAGATASALELESRAVTRSLRGHLNRVLNAEGANLSRSVATASRQLEAIGRLEGSGSLGSLPAEVRAVAKLRRESPEATFTEIAERLGISRARVQRAFERLESAALGSGEERVAPG